jgi:hypothetical protein
VPSVLDVTVFTVMDDAAFVEDIDTVTVVVDCLVDNGN